MIRSFAADETTRDLFGSVNSKAARGIPNTAWRAAQRKLKQLDLVATLDDLKIPPGNDLPALKGGQAGRHAIRLPARFWLHLQADYDLQIALNEEGSARHGARRTV